MHQPTFDDSTRRWSEPELVQTDRGLWPAAGLERTVVEHEDENEWSSAVEYRLAGAIVPLVHRSVRLHLKKASVAAGVAADLA